jgi:polysaccharide biosynthesis/export protein
MPEREPAASLPSRLALARSSWSGSASACTLDDPPPPGAASRPRPSATLSARSPVRLSRGDVVNVMLSDGEEFNGDYTIGPDGTIGLPYLPRLRAKGTTEEELAKLIERALVRQRLFLSPSSRVAVRVVRYSAIEVHVSGAVFQKGLQTINEAAEKNNDEISSSKNGVRKFGDFTFKRTLTAALRVASGVRPDADISAIEVHRRGKSYRVDLRGAVRGTPLTDPILEDGDEVIVPAKGCFQAELAKPSHITPRGIRIYVSKIHFAADSRYDEKIPYGLRLLQAAVMASCIGGIKPTRGHREIVLLSTNPATGDTEVVQRSVEELLRDKDRDTINPFLMPDDGVACYDSPIVEGVDVAQALTAVMAPVRLLQQIRAADR